MNGSAKPVQGGPDDGAEWIDLSIVPSSSPKTVAHALSHSFDEIWISNLIKELKGIQECDRRKKAKELWPKCKELCVRCRMHGAPDGTLNGRPMHGNYGCMAGEFGVQLYDLL